MKSLKFKSLVILISLFLISNSDILAQRGMGQKGTGQRGAGFANGQCNLPNISKEQQAKISKLRTAHMKESQKTRNIMGEKRARLQTLQTADKVDMKAVNKTIDEIGVLRTEMHKKRATHRQSVRNLLTDEQKVVFDSKRGRNGKGFGKGRGYGKAYGKGKGRRACGGGRF